jgi:polysaccharide deacetylase family protein (PEP-CTERM system associated)
MINALTIDLEDWYQGLTSTSVQIDRWPSFEDRVVENTEKILNILDEAGVKATFFTLGYVADQFPSLIRSVADAGHELALHGYFHKKVFQHSQESFRDEIILGREMIQNTAGQSIYGHRAPMFSIKESTLWAIDLLDEMGFYYDSSVFPTKNMLYGYPTAPREPYHPIEGSKFMEFPMSTVEFGGVKWPISGGFYYRLLPYPLIQKAVKKLHEQGLALIYYLHPWELDPDHPRSPLRLSTVRERFTHYWGLRSTEKKLRSLLNDFEFTTMINLYRTYCDQSNGKAISTGY